MAECLPPDEQPQLRNPHDAIAIFTHACMLSVGFKLVGLSEDDCLASPSDQSAPQPLPSNWNSGSGGSYGFRYSHPQSSMQFLVKVNRLGGKSVIMGLGLGDDKTTSFDVDTKDFTSTSFFPYSSSSNGEPKNLEDGFISANRMSDLAILIKINIVQKLVPGISKPGYEEEGAATGGGGGGSAQAPRQQQQQPRRDRDDGQDPLRVPWPYRSPYGGGGYPRGDPPPMPAGGERIPGFDDDYDIYRPPGGGGGGYPPGGRNPLSIGEDDLIPPGLGPNPPLRGPFIGEGGGMGGMHPAPDHPMFGGRGGGGRMGGAGYGRAPPGSRYDPVHPGDEQPTGRPRGPHGPGGPGFGPYNPFSGYGSGDFM